MDIAAAQRDLSSAYIGGAPAVLVSGLVWIVAGVLHLFHGAMVGFAALFLGGILIVPLALLIIRLVFRADPPTPGNPLQRLGFEGAVVLFAGLWIGFTLLQIAPVLAFPAVALAIGARYFAFRTLYGDGAYWALGGALCLIGVAAILRPMPWPGGLLLLVGLAECVFAPILYLRWKTRVSAASRG